MVEALKPCFNLFSAALLGGIVAFGCWLQGKWLKRQVGTGLTKILFSTRKFHYLEPSSFEGQTPLPYGVVISFGVVLWFIVENFSQ
jgi:hypothetical protein